MKEKINELRIKLYNKLFKWIHSILPNQDHSRTVFVMAGGGVYQSEWVGYITDREYIEPNVYIIKVLSFDSIDNGMQLFTFKVDFNKKVRKNTYLVTTFDRVSNASLEVEITFCKPFESHKEDLIKIMTNCMIESGNVGMFDNAFEHSNGIQDLVNAAKRIKASGRRLELDTHADSQ